MTKKRAERLTGYEIRRLPENDCKGRLAYGAFSGDELIVQCSHSIEEFALQALVREVYQLHSIYVLEEHGWRCARCRSVRRLQIHHRRYRSHGGTHRTENLEPVCWDCHKLIHKSERSK
jgi:5-methylcytosine-specific restriction endonuclease McrA